MKTAFWISNRMRLSSGDSNSAGAVIAVAGVALAVMVMEITLAVVSGFKSEITRKITGFDSQITIACPYDGVSGEQDDMIRLTPDLMEYITDNGRIDLSPSVSVHLPAMLKTDDDFAAILFVGHDEAHDLSFEKENIVEGIFPDYSLEENSDKIVVSAPVASGLKLNIGDNIYAYFFIDGSVKTRKVGIAGIYKSNLTEYDKTVAYAPVSLLQKLIGADSDGGTLIEIGGLSVDDIDLQGIALQQRLTDAFSAGDLDKFYPVTTVKQSGAIYFNWLSLLDTNIVVIFVLMLCVALFTLISSLYMIILDRIPAIGILKSIGASRRWLTRLFVNIGMRLAVMGMIVGNVFGLGICMLQSYTGLLKLDPQMYYLDVVPIEVEPGPMLLLNLGVILVAWLILFVPARSAARIDATESMRYE